eukprot:5602458-Amphidinium_carterae.1
MVILESKSSVPLFLGIRLHHCDAQLQATRGTVARKSGIINVPVAASASVLTGGATAVTLVALTTSRDPKHEDPSPNAHRRADSVNNPS